MSWHSDAMYVSSELHCLKMLIKEPARQPGVITDYWLPHIGNKL
jgi:hypothetical protein